MKSFIEYIEDNLEKTETKESLFNDLINFALQKYPEDVEDFLSLISAKDPKIAEIVEKIRDLNSKFNDKDSISPNLPDNNFGNEEIY